MSGGWPDRLIADDAFPRLPDRQRDALRDAIRAESWSLGYQITLVVAMALVMGSSQAMRSAWVEDVLGLVAPITFLVTARLRWRSPDAKFPYGYHRVVALTYLVAAVALVGLGGYALINSVVGLVKGSHEGLGQMHLFGAEVWRGWVMLPVLVWGAVPAWFLGRWKTRLARTLNDKSLYADASMNRADWITAVGAMLAVALIGFGLKWSDAVIGGLIGLDIVRDGARHLHAVVAELLDRSPKTVDLDADDPLPDTIAERVGALAWVRDVHVRARGSGNMVTADVLVVPRDDREALARTREARDVVRDIDWRLAGVTVSLLGDPDDDLLWKRSADLDGSERCDDDAPVSTTPMSEGERPGSDAAVGDAS